MTQSKSGKGEVRSEIKKLADLVQKEVEDGATTVEEIHKAIASLPLDILERLDVFEGTVKGVRKVQDTSIGAIYDVIRRVNHEVGNYAKELLEGRAAHKPAHKPVHQASHKKS
jgi:methyl-accepting chemotaxis protein